MLLILLGIVFLALSAFLFVSQRRAEAGENPDTAAWGRFFGAPLLWGFFVIGVLIITGGLFIKAAHAAEAVTKTMIDFGGAGSTLLLLSGASIASALAPLILARLPGFAKIFVSQAAIKQAILVVISQTAGLIAGQPPVSVETSNKLINDVLALLKANWPAFLHWIVDRCEPAIIAEAQSLSMIPASATKETLGSKALLAPPPQASAPQVPAAA